MGLYGWKWSPLNLSVQILVHGPVQSPGFTLSLSPDPFPRERLGSGNETNLIYANEGISQVAAVTAYYVSLILRMRTPHVELSVGVRYTKWRLVAPGSPCYNMNTLRCSNYEQILPSGVSGGGGGGGGGAPP